MSAITEKLVKFLRARSRFGKKKYKGKTLDRKDLTTEEWFQHLLEELGDAMGYAQAAKESAEKDKLLLELAWGLLANVSGGDWKKQSEQWQRGASNWRGHYLKENEVARTAS